MKRSIFTLMILIVILIATSCAAPSTTIEPEDTVEQNQEAQSSPQSPPVGVSVNQLAPDTALQMLDGGTVQASDYRGKPVILYFWATWCGFCVEELPNLQALYEKYGSQVEIIAISCDNDSQTVKDFMAQNNYTVPVAMDTDLSASRIYQAQALPQKLLLDQEGIVYNRIVGQTTPEAMENIVQTLLGKS